MGVGASHLEGARRRPDRGLDRRAVVEVFAGEGAGRAQFVDGTFEHDFTALGPGARPEVHDVVGDRDGLRLVLDDQDSVALVAQLQQQVVHPRDVVWVQADGGFVQIQKLRPVQKNQPDIRLHALAQRQAAGRRI